MTEPPRETKADHRSASAPQAAARSDVTQRDPRRASDFRDLARRISTWTTNLLAISILAVAALAMAGRLTEWWRAEPPGPETIAPAVPPGPWDAADGLVLEFGDAPWSIHRQMLAGSNEEASYALLEQCREILNAPAQPGLLPAADASEQALIDRLRDTAPIEEVPGRWRLYSIGGPLPWIVGMTTATGTDVGDGNLQRKPDDAEGAARLLCWGLALPQSDRTWTLYVIDRRPEERGGNSLPTVPLPNGARRSLGVSSADGGTLTTFSGAGPAMRWMIEFDEALTAGGWRRLGDWSRGGTSHAAVYQCEFKSETVRLEITLTPGPDGRWLGVAETHRGSPGPTTEKNAP